MSECFTIMGDHIALTLEIKGGKYTLHDDRVTLTELELDGYDTEEIEGAIQKTMHRISYEKGLIFMPTNAANVWSDFRFMLEEITKLFARFENKKIGENNARTN